MSRSGERRGPPPSQKGPGPEGGRSSPGASEGTEDAGARKGPPPLRPFGLVLHHDGSWTHEGQPIRNRRLREHFDRSVRYLPEEGKYVVTLRHFRGQIEVEEAGFFVRHVDRAEGTLALSDGSEEPLDPASLRPSSIDGAWLCTVKRDLVTGGLPARFTHAAQSELLQGVEEGRDGEPVLRIGGRLYPVRGL